MTTPKMGESEIEERALAGVLAPVALLPIQFLEGKHGDDPATSAMKRLMVAVLEDALRCLQSYTVAHTALAYRNYIEAQAWIADHQAQGPFAFTSICEALGIEPNRLRLGLQDWCLQISAGMNHRRLTRRSFGRTAAPLHARPRRSRKRG